MFSRYRMLRFLGQPPPDIVCLGRDEKTGVHAAMHLLPQALVENGGDTTILEETLELLSEDPLEGIPQIWGWSFDGETTGFIEAFVEGENLADVIERSRKSGNRLPLTVIARILDGLAAVVEGAHAAGFIHGDIRPSKIILQGRRTFLLGYPWSSFRPFRLENCSSATLAYLPPEAIVNPQTRDGQPPVIRNEYETDIQSDMYQVGLVAYELATGTRPFPDSRGIEAAARRARSDLPRVSDARRYFPSDFEGLIFKLLETNPRKRFRSMGAFRRALDLVMKKARRKNRQKARNERNHRRRPMPPGISVTGTENGVNAGEAPERMAAESSPARHEVTGIAQGRHSNGHGQTRTESDRLLPRAGPDETAAGPYHALELNERVEAGFVIQVCRLVSRLIDPLSLELAAAFLIFILSVWMIASRESPATRPFDVVVTTERCAVR